MWMVLAPGEVFQHAHAEQSITMLVDGTVDLELGDDRTALVPGAPTPIDAYLPHRLINVGSDIAVVKCIHLEVDVNRPAI